MGPGVNHLDPADRRHPHGPAHVVTKHEERSADRKGSAVGGHACHDCAHGVFSYAKVQQAPGRILRREDADVFQHRARIAGQVSPAAHQLRDRREERVGTLAAGDPGGDFGACGIHRQGVVPTVHMVSLHHGQKRITIGSGRYPPVPRRSGCSPASAGRPVEGKNVIWNVEVGGGKPKNFLRFRHFIGPERRSVST